MSTLGQAVAFTRKSIPLPSDSTPEYRSQNMAVERDFGMGDMQLCLTGGLASIEGSRVNCMPLTPSPSPSWPNFPLQLDSQPDQSMGREFNFDAGLSAGLGQKLRTSSSQVDYMPPTPTPSPSRSTSSQPDCQPEQQVGRGGNHSRSQPTRVEVYGHWFDEFREGSSAKRTYCCADIRCIGAGLGQSVGRKQECKRHGKKTGGAAVINCAYPDREQAGCEYPGNCRPDKVREHERKAHDYHRDGCACSECKPKGKGKKWA